MTGDEETRLTVPRGTGDRDMSITGRLHRHGRLRKSRSSESDVERSLTVQDTIKWVVIETTGVCDIMMS